MNEINNIPEGWSQTTLGQIIDIKHGFAFKGQFISVEPNNIILVTPGNFKVGGGFKSEKFKYYSGDIPKDYILKPNDVIVTMTDLSKEGDTLGFSAKVPTDYKTYLHNQRIGLVQFINSDFDKEFIYWFLRTKHYQKSMVISATGSTVRHTSPNRIKEYSFYCPKFLEQKSIVSILTAFNDKIELLQAQNITLEETAQTIFKEWFGAYQIGDSLPKGWRYGTLEDVAFHIKENIKPFDNPDSEYYHFSLPAYDKGLKPDLEIGDMIKSIKYAVKSNSFLVSKLNPFTPRIWTIYESEENHICSTEFQVVKPKEELFFSLIHCFLNTDNFTKELSQKIKGTSSSHQRVSPQDVFDVTLIIPKEPDLIKLDELLRPLILKKGINLKQIQTLIQTRDALLPKLMSGVVRVNEFKD